MKIKIRKLKELEDAMHPNNFEEGYETTREMPDDMFRAPVVGQRFYCGTFWTSAVQEIVSEDTFKTHNSIYKWEILKEDENN